MDNRDKMNKNVGSSSSNLDKSKDESKVDFGKNTGRSENLGSEPSRRSGSVDSSSGSNLGKQDISSRKGSSGSSEH